MNCSTSLRIRPKRRWRLRRYQSELHYLRPVTSEALHELDTRAPDGAAVAREVICFAVKGAHPGDTTEYLAIIAFGYDGICRIADLRYNSGFDVERIPHRIDLAYLRVLVAQRRKRWRRQNDNDLSAQLLIRFIADINNRITDTDYGLEHFSGAFLQFRDAWQTAEPSWEKIPECALRKRLKRGLQAIMRTDPGIPSGRYAEVDVFFGSDALLADYDDLRRHFFEDGQLDTMFQGVFSPEKELLTERFVALAWLAFADFSPDDLMARSIERTGDAQRTGGWGSEEVGWKITCRIPCREGRRRARSRFRKWFRRAIANFESRYLEPAGWDRDWAFTQSERHIARRKKLLPWAERRWHSVKDERISALKIRLERESEGDALFVQQREHEVDKHRRLAALFRNFAALGPAAGSATLPILGDLEGKSENHQ